MDTLHTMLGVAGIVFAFISAFAITALISYYTLRKDKGGRGRS